MNLEYAVQQFEKYLDQYDREDDKVRLKIVHTYGVMECSRQIAERMRLPEEDLKLGQLIGLLHDIGRFEQLKRFDSFEPDTMDHAEFGVELLFSGSNGEKGLIRNFVPEDTWDGVIRTAIANHSKFKMDDIADAREILHVRLIRDADKLDNCRVKLEDSIETILGVSAEDVGKTAVSPEVMEQFRREESIASATRKTKMDYWISYLAYFFDVNFCTTFRMIQERQYVKRLIDRIPYSNRQTAEDMECVKTVLEKYIAAHSKVCRAERDYWY